MPWFEYKGTGASGKPVSGRIGGNDAEHAMELLQMKQLDVSSLIEIEAPPSKRMKTNSPSTGPSYVDGGILVMIGMLIGLVGLFFAFSELVIVTWFLGAISSICIMVGIIRLAISPLMHQQQRIIDLLSSRINLPTEINLPFQPGMNMPGPAMARCNISPVRYVHSHNQQPSEIGHVLRIRFVVCVYRRRGTGSRNGVSPHCRRASGRGD